MITNLTIRKTKFCFSLLFAMLLALPAMMTAQEIQGSRTKNPLPDYTLESESTTYTPLTGGTVYSIQGNVIERDEVWLPIGFTFSMGCYDYDSFFPTQSGTLSIGKNTAAATGLPNDNSFTANSITDNAFLAPFWGSLNRTGGIFSYKTTGVEGSRVFTAEWKNWGVGSTTNVISFQVKIYEGTNTVEYIYNQEANSSTMMPASIGIYFATFRPTPKQLWLTNASANPGTSLTFSNTITVRPASGQLYRFLNNDSGIECTYYGRTVINPAGGNNATDGLRVVLSGTGNMQITKKNIRQIFNGQTELLRGTTYPTQGPGFTSHGMVLSVGTSVFAGGNLFPTSSMGANVPLTVISSTKQSLVEYAPGHFKNVIKMSAVKNGMTYYLDVTYNYTYPDKKCLIDYTITIPPGNTEPVKFAHGWDSFLEGGDTGPGFVKGTAPSLVMGVFKSPSYEAFEYIGGLPWSGYYSGDYMDLNNNISRPGKFMIYDTSNPGGFRPINNSPVADNGIGISIDFGDTPGTYTSNNAIIFACPAGDIAPVLKSTIAKPCSGTTFNLNDYVSSKPAEGIEVIWKDASGVKVTDPTAVSIAGVYTVTYYSDKYDCTSPVATLTVTYDNSCAVCYKPAVTTGTAEPFKTIISTLDRVQSPRNWSDPITGSLILESKQKGLVLTRIASPETAIAVPVEGMLVYDTVENVLKVYNGTAWKTLTQSCPDY